MSICRLCKCSFEKRATPYYFLCERCHRKQKNRIKAQNKRKNKKGSLEFSTWMDCLLMHNFTCRFCNQKPEILDHIVSFYNGGNNSLENLQPLCKNCDNKKTKIERLLHSMDPHKFKHGTKMFDDARQFFDKIDFAA